MTFLLALLPFLSLTAATPVYATTSTFPNNTILTFSQNTFPYTSRSVLSADITPVSTEPGACYPHNFATAYLATDVGTSVLNFTTTAPTKKNGRTPVALSIEGGCWGLGIEQGALVLREGGGIDGWYVDSGNVLRNEKAPHGLYYCADTTGQGVVGAEDKQLTHAGSIYGVCFDFNATIATASAVL